MTSVSDTMSIMICQVSKTVAICICSLSFIKCVVHFLWKGYLKIGKSCILPQRNCHFLIPVLLVQPQISPSLLRTLPVMFFLHSSVACRMCESARERTVPYNDIHCVEVQMNVPPRPTPPPHPQKHHHAWPLAGVDTMNESHE